VGVEVEVLLWVVKLLVACEVDEEFYEGFWVYDGSDGDGRTSELFCLVEFLISVSIGPIGSLVVEEFDDVLFKAPVWLVLLSTWAYSLLLFTYSTLSGLNSSIGFLSLISVELVELCYDVISVVLFCICF